MKGFDLSLFGYSIIGGSFGWYTAWPCPKNGTNYWCLEFYLGPSAWGIYKSVKLDFWRPLNLAGWQITIYYNGQECIYVGGKGRLIRSYYRKHV